MASDAITPINESALEMGCFWKTRLKAQTIEITAKTMTRTVSIVPALENRHKQRGEQQVDQGGGEQECPREVHKLVIAESGQRAANPDVGEQQEPYFGAEPEDWR